MMTRDTPHTDDDTSHGRLRRRRFLAATGSFLAATSAGCLSQLGFEEQGARAPPLLDDRPDAVYHPTHNEGMQMVGMKETGPYTVTLSYAFPHRFWTVEGEDISKVSIDRDDSMHLMTSVWHTEAGIVVPTAEPTLTITRDGDSVTTNIPWQMLSQSMGFHFGDNFQLPESGTYAVEVSLPPPTTTLVGSLGDGFDDASPVTFDLDFDPETVQSLDFEQFDDKAGSRAALEPMGMPAVKNSQLPPPADLPGQSVGQAELGDGVFVVRSLDAPPAGLREESGDGETYLGVSARTPYNRYPLALMSLSATVSGDDGTRFDGPMEPVLHPEFGYHYGVVVDELASGDTLKITVDSPPGAARHEGYETAFFEMDEATIDV